MSRIFLFTQFLLMMLVCKQTIAVHGLFHLPLRLSTTFDHQQIYLQPHQQLIVYPEFHQTSLPQFYRSPQNLFIPQNTYSTSRYIFQQPIGKFYDPIVSYIQQTPHTISSYMNFNLNKKLPNEKFKVVKEINMDTSDKSIESGVFKSEVTTDSSSTTRDDQYISKEIPEEMMITSDNSIETSTIFEIVKDKIENMENPTTINTLEVNSETTM